MTSLYAIYEKYSSYYIIDISSLSGYLDTLPTSESQIDQWLSVSCYYNLPHDRVDDFERKLRHNLELGQHHQDLPYLHHLHQKFNLPTDIDLTTWSYHPKKITIKLKMPTSSASTSSIIEYSANVQLLQLLKRKPDEIFKYKSSIIRLVHKYIYENKLQNYEHKVRIDPNPQLAQILPPLHNGDTYYTYFNLPMYLNSLITCG